jgi:hypothetical protein
MKGYPKWISLGLRSCCLHCRGDKIAVTFLQRTNVTIQHFSRACTGRVIFTGAVKGAGAGGLTCGCGATRGS